jgi:hypothetical protein
MPITSLSAILCIPLVVLSDSGLPQQILSLELGEAPLQVVDVRIYAYHENVNPDYHVGELDMDGAPWGEPVVINGLVRNQNHTSEHFDYITVIIDPNGYTVNIDIRPGVAVPLGRELGIGSENSQIVFNETGTYIAKVFTWRNLAKIPEPLSTGAVLEIPVAILPRPTDTIAMLKDS